MKYHTIALRRKNVGAMFSDFGTRNIFPAVVAVSRVVSFLADHTARQYMIGYWHHPVVRPSARL